MEYTESLDGLGEDDLQPFFVGWPNSPSPSARLAMLAGSYRVILARDEDHVVGFVTAVSDGVFAAFLPLLEVLPEYQHRGIGSELVHRMTASLSEMYIVDLVCDPELAPFYERLGMLRLAGMAIRNRHVLPASTSN